MVSELVLMETACVMSSVYEVPRDDVVDALIAFVQKRNLKALGLPKTLVLEALLACRGSRRVSFVDAFLWAQARHSDSPRICTFDARFPSAGVELVRPV